MTSANISGISPCSNLDDIEKNFPLLDGMLEGDIIYGESSTIVSLVDDVKIIREGPISLQDILDAI